jgi:hypothetical protein
VRRAGLLCASLIVWFGLGMRASAERPAVIESYGGAAPVLTVALQVPVTSLTADFTLTLSQQSVSVARGGTSTLSVKSEDMNGFSSQINLACSGMPSGTSCVFDPPNLDPSGTATLTVKAANTVPPYGNPMGMMGMALSGLGLVGMVFHRRREENHRGTGGRLWWRMSGIALLLGLTAAAMGCGYSSMGSQTAVGTKNVMVVGTSGTLNHSVPLSLTVM